MLPLLLALTTPAQAASCCLPASSASPGVLAPTEAYGGAVAVGVDERLGAWAWDGDYAGAATDRRQVYTARLAAMVRLSGPLQVAVDLPASARSYTVAEVHETGVGVGDLGATLRIDASQRGTWPATARPAVTLGVSIPTGRGWDDAATTTGADVTGAGSTVVRGGLAWEGLIVRGVWTAGVSAELPTGAPASLQVVPAVGAGWRAKPQFDLRAGLAAEVGPAATAVSVVPVVSAGAVWRLSKVARLLPGVSVAPPIPGIGRNGESWVRVGVAAVVGGAAPPS